MMITAPYDQQKASAKYMCSDCTVHVFPLYQNHIYANPPLPLWSSSSELTEVLSAGCSPHFAPH